MAFKVPDYKNYAEDAGAASDWTAEKVEDLETRLGAHIDSGRGITPNSNMAETFPRWSISQALSPQPGRVHLTRIRLAAGSYTTLTGAKGGTVGSGHTQVFFGIYPIAGGAPLGSSSDQATSFNALAAATQFTATVNSTIATAGDYWVACLIGGATAMASLAAPGTGLPAASFNLAPALISDHTPISGITALPGALSVVGASSNRPFWFRYE